MYYSSTHSDIHHWMGLSAECNVPAALTTSSQTWRRVTRVFCLEACEDHSACLETLNERWIFISKRVLNYIC